jgi:hypothetical protein
MFNKLAELWRDRWCTHADPGIKKAADEIYKNWLREECRLRNFFAGATDKPWAYNVNNCGLEAMNGKLKRDVQTNHSFIRAADVVKKFILDESLARDPSFASFIEFKNKAVDSMKPKDWVLAKHMTTSEMFCIHHFPPHLGQAALVVDKSKSPELFGGDGSLLLPVAEALLQRHYLLKWSNLDEAVSMFTKHFFVTKFQNIWYCLCADFARRHCCSHVLAVGLVRKLYTMPPNVIVFPGQHNRKAGRGQTGRRHGGRYAKLYAGATAPPWSLEEEQEAAEELPEVLMEGQQGGGGGNGESDSDEGEEDDHEESSVEEEDEGGSWGG